MKLSCRGVQYEYHQPTLEVTEGEMLSQYQHLGRRCHTLKDIPLPLSHDPQPVRGDRNVLNPPQDTNSNIGASRQVRFCSPLPIASIGQDLDRVHRTNLHRNLERRLQIARERGDYHLVALLETESRQLALNGILAGG
jgi:hypothetical protein